MRVRRTDLDQRDVDSNATLLDELGDFRKKDRHEVGPTLVYRVADVRPDEECRVAETLIHRFFDVGRRAESEEMDDLVVSEVTPVLDHRVDEVARFGRPGSDQDPAAGRDGADRFLGCRHTVGVTRRPIVLVVHFFSTSW